MAISYVGAAATTNTAVAVLSSGAVSLPTVASGDLLILAVHRVHDYPLTQGTPTGYVFLRNIVDVGTSPAASQTDLYYRICDGTEGATGPTFTTGTVTRWLIHAVAYRGVDTTSPFLAENGQVEASATVVTAHSAPAITNTDANAWAVFAALGRLLTPASWTPPTGLADRLDTDPGAATAVNPVGEWADSAGTVATGTVTYTATASQATNSTTAWAAFLRPSTGPATPTGLTATPVSSTQINLSWNAASGATGYDIERDGVVIVTGQAGTTYSDTGRAPATLYSYRVRSSN